MREVTITTDGACSGNPGPGGWGAILRAGKAVKKMSGFAPQTTNNQMELIAAINSIQILNEPCKVTLRTDSKYVAEGVSSLDAYKERGWATKTKEPLKNGLLWMIMDNILARHEIHIEKLAGHSGDPDNEECDRMAKQAIAEGRHV